MIEKKSNLILLLLEATGLFGITTLYFEIVSPLFSSMGFLGNLLKWISYAAFGVIVFYTIRKLKDKWSFKDLGFKVYRNWKQDILLGIVIYCFLFLINIPFFIPVVSTYSEMFTENIGALSQQPVIIIFLLATLMVFVTGFFTGALHEEISYRGYLQGLFSKSGFPLIGFFISFITFSFHHYFSHPEWNLFQVLHTILPGIILCLAYFATESLIVVITIHALGNLVPIYGPLAHSLGYPTFSVLIIIITAVISILILIVFRRDFIFFIKKSRELFLNSGFIIWLLGVSLGITFLFLWHELKQIKLQFGLNNLTYYVLLLAFSVGCILISFLKFRKSPKLN